MGYGTIQNKVVLVTGANHGIGAATALAFAKEGARLFLNYYRKAAEAYGVFSEGEGEKDLMPGRALYHRMQAQTADHVVDKIQRMGGSCAAWEADLSLPETIPELFDRAKEQLGAVDIVVNNAAFGRLDSFLPTEELEKQRLFAGEFPIAPLTPESHDQHFAVNSRAVALMTQEFARRFIRRNANDGRIINVSSDGARSHPCAVSYGASKHALESYTRAAAAELGAYGITVNAVSPGAVQTGWLQSDVVEQIENTYALKRVGEPEDIADVIVFLASEQARWITGQVIHVNGGNPQH